MYIDAMTAAGFEHTSPLFVATGLLSYGAEIEFKVGPLLVAVVSACRGSRLWWWGQAVVD
jgi:hypothetical protein